VELLSAAVHGQHRDIDLKPAEAGGLSGLWIGHTHQGLITLVEPLAK
jgi:hypothetical protein